MNVLIEQLHQRCLLSNDSEPATDATATTPAAAAATTTTAATTNTTTTTTNTTLGFGLPAYVWTLISMGQAINLCIFPVRPPKNDQLIHTDVEKSVDNVHVCVCVRSENALITTCRESPEEPRPP